MSRERIAVVTGAGGGVGFAAAELLASEGSSVVLVGRDAKKLESASRELKAAHDVKTLICAGNVTDSDFADRVFAGAMKAFGALPVDLINNAGVIVRLTAENTTDEDWRRVMATNIDGVFYLSRAMARAAPAGSSIVNVSSTCGQVGAAGLAAYCASKGAVDQLTRTMALELAAREITVNAVAPGAINSPMLFSEHHDPALADSVVSRNEASIPLGRVAEPEEVAAAIVFLTKQRHITGTVLSVDGGYVAQ